MRPYTRNLGQPTFETVLSVHPYEGSYASGVSELVLERLVPEGRLELPRAEAHCALNAARLPIPPLRH